MHILVLGAGVVGVTTAYYLTAQGHQVDVIDAEPEPGSGASGVNAGLLVPADSTVWSSPAMIARTARALAVHRSDFLRVSTAAGRQLIPWGLRFLAQCTPVRYRRHVAAAHLLSQYSYRTLRELLEVERLEFGHEHNGMVFLFRTESALREGLAARKVLARIGEGYRVLSTAQLAELDSAYRHADPVLSGAIYAPSSGHGDCRAFCISLCRRARDLGAGLIANTRVEKLEVKGSAVAAVHTTRGPMRADAYVLALGAWSAPIARAAGITLPVVPVKGYAMTVPIARIDGIPQVGGVDEDHHVAFSRHADSLRLSSTAEFSGYNSDHQPRNFESIRTVADSLFPGALDWAGARRSTGLRAVTPSGLPLVGLARDNLYLNVGHGHLGWTQACGSARLLADLIGGHPTGIDPRAYLP